MGFITIYCPISGLPLDFSYDNDDDDVKYRHLNEANVVLPDGTITEIGGPDYYGRIIVENVTYQCNGDEDDYDDYGKKYDFGIAISNCVYKLLLLHPKFIDFINKKKNLYDYINTHRSYIEKSNPVMKYFGDQSPCLEKISPKDIPYYVDPFLEEKIEEPLLGSTQVRGTRKINGKKNKKHLEKIINTFLDFIPETGDAKASDELIDFERMNIK